MEKERMVLLQEMLAGDIQDVRFGTNGSKTIAVLIDNQNGKSDDKKELLEKEGFVVFSPRNLSKVAVENMKNWTKDSRKAYQAIKLPSCLMIVDSTQEEKSQLLARTIIRFYNETAGNYNLLNKPNSDGNMIPAFEDVGELDVLLVRVGFVVQKSDDGNTVTVNGDGFTLTVDGQSGEIVDTTQQGKLGTGDITSEDKILGFIPEAIFEYLYDKGKEGIEIFKRYLERLRGNPRER